MHVSWLHISDVHSHESEGHHRTAMYAEIVAAVKARSDKPDFVFFTGDLAYSGAKTEYDLLENHLLVPLRSALPSPCKFFAVPGNHDVDRKRIVNPRLWMTEQRESDAFQEVSAIGQRKRRDALLARFQEYCSIESRLFDWKDNWLDSERGTACSVETVGGRCIAIVGINTAWLCHDNDDWGKLTAGRTMVDAGLRKAADANADITIVLGHHPLAAMKGEKPWSDGARIEARLSQANAVYLHGHLHRSGAQQTGDSMRSVLAIQAPSGFQAGDNATWRNGILWGGVDFSTRRVIIQPLRWNDEHQCYVPDSDAAPPHLRVPDIDGFAYRLPGKAPESNALPVATVLGQVLPSVPDGWEVINRDALGQRTATRPSAAMMKDWFDGQFPRWEVAAAEGVRPRRVVEDVARRFAAAHAGASQPTVTLFTGAGGEGKSAALLQVAASLLRGEQEWTCVSRKAAAAELPDDLFAKLSLRPGHAWIIVVDDAENIGRQLAAAMRGLQPRTDVHLLLAARAADWAIRGLTDAVWQGVAEFRRATIAGLDADDARRIADGWAAYGDEAKGAMLRGKSAEQIAAALLEQARQSAARQDEGALLGALLMARSGEDLKARVGRLITPLAGAPGVGEYSLRDVYAMIVAMHAENQLYLSRTVLAYALNCSEAELDQGSLRLLRNEAMLDTGGTYILTRHRRVAEAARDWLVETGERVDRWYPWLARAALRQFLQQRPSTHDMAMWCNELPRHFTQQPPNRRPVAVAITKALFEAHPADPMRLTSYSSTLRRTGNAGSAFDLMSKEAPAFSRRRDVLYEWSVSAGGAGDYGLDVWLAAKSFADDTGPDLTPLRFKLGLAGLGAAFRNLRSMTQDPRFSAGQAACGRLGLMLQEVDVTTKGYFEEHARAEQSRSAMRPTVQTDIDTMRRAITAAADEVQVENNPPAIADLIGEPDGYRFSALAALLSDRRPGHEGGRDTPKPGRGLRR